MREGGREKRRGEWSGVEIRKGEKEGGSCVERERGKQARRKGRRVIVRETWRRRESRKG